MYSILFYFIYKLGKYRIL